MGPRQALLRGLLTSRSNWPLVVARWLQDLLTVGLATAGLMLPWLAVFGRDVAEDLAPLVRARDVEALAEAVLDVWEAVVAAPGAVTAGLTGLAVTWTLALCIYCWAQGGIWGSLSDAERAAGAGSAADVAAVFRPGRFVRHAGRYFWRLFWLVNLYATAVLGLVLVWLLPLVWLPRSPGGEASWLALVVAAVLLVPVGLAVAVAALWYALARADLVVAETTARAATRRAWRTLRRRPGPPILVSLSVLAAIAVVSGVLAPLSTGSLLLGGMGGLAGAVLAIQAVLFAIQGLVGGWLATVHAGAFVALGSAAEEVA